MQDVSDLSLFIDMKKRGSLESDVNFMPDLSIMMSSPPIIVLFEFQSKLSYF
jgi:hypothetical protein